MAIDDEMISRRRFVELTAVATTTAAGMVLAQHVPFAIAQSDNLPDDDADSEIYIDDVDEQGDELSPDACENSRDELADGLDAANPDTALLVMTDWHAHADNASVAGIAAEACYLSKHYENVIVVMNGDSEDASSNKNTNTVSTWHRDNDYATPLMLLARELAKIDGVHAVVGLGNHELAMNSLGAKTGKQFAKYIKTLKGNYGNDRLHIINTDLYYQDSYMSALFDGGNPLIERSCEVAGIYFISGLDPRAVAEECASNKSDASYAAYHIGYAGRKGALYAHGTVADPLKASVKALSSAIASIQASDPGAAIMLLEHSGARSTGTGFASFRDKLGLTTQTVVVCGHDHKKPYLRDKSGGTCVLQPDRYGEGADILYASGGNWVRTSKHTVKITFGKFSGNTFSVKA